MFIIEEPRYFILLLIIPILLVIFLAKVLWQKRIQKKFANADLLKKLAPKASFFKSALKLLFLLIVICSLIFSLVNPKMGIKLETVKREGVDIVFALDISKSMLAEDIAPNRLEKAKHIVSKVIEKLASDRVGIIVYAGSAYPLLPITTDHSVVRMFLKNLDPSMLSSQGTAIGEALKIALTFFNYQEQTSRYLFLISDGEDHEREAVQMAKKASEKGIKVYTIGIGTPKGGPIPIRENNRLVEYKKDRQGKVVITQLDSKNLENIAREGKGLYLLGNNTQNTVDSIENILSNAKKTELETKQFSDYKLKYQWFVGFGLLFLLLDVFLLEKKTSWIQKLNLFNEN